MKIRDVFCLSLGKEGKEFDFVCLWAFSFGTVSLEDIDSAVDSNFSQKITENHTEGFLGNNNNS